MFQVYAWDSEPALGESKLMQSLWGSVPLEGPASSSNFSWVMKVLITPFNFFKKLKLQHFVILRTPPLDVLPTWHCSAIMILLCVFNRCIKQQPQCIQGHSDPKASRGLSGSPRAFHGPSLLLFFLISDVFFTEHTVLGQFVHWPPKFWGQLRWHLRIYSYQHSPPISARSLHAAEINKSSAQNQLFAWDESFGKQKLQLICVAVTEGCPLQTKLGHEFETIPIWLEMHCLVN